MLLQLIVVGVPVIVVLAVGIHVSRQHGRILIRVEALEQHTQPRPSEHGLTASRIERNGLKAGTLAPPIDLPDLNGGHAALADFRGRHVLLVFSDPHCAPCDALAPRLTDLELRHRGDGLALMMVSRGDVAENRRKADQHGFGFPVVLQRRWEVSKEFGIFATPVAFLIGPDGVIVRDVGIGMDGIMALAGEPVPVRTGGET